MCLFFLNVADRSPSSQDLGIICSNAHAGLNPGYRRVTEGCFHEETGRSPEDLLGLPRLT